eukprot:2546998-Amphidinium_carterae.1
MHKDIEKKLDREEELAETESVMDASVEGLDELREQQCRPRTYGTQDCVFWPGSCGDSASGKGGTCSMHVSGVGVFSVLSAPSPSHLATPMDVVEVPPAEVRLRDEEQDAPVRKGQQVLPWAKKAKPAILLPERDRPPGLQRNFLDKSTRSGERRVA